MTFPGRRVAKTRQQILSCLFVIFTLAVQPAVVTAADTGPPEIQGTLRDSLEAVWTGGEFSPELVKRQQALKALLKAGTLTKNDLESAMEKIFLSILDSQKTSRYLLKTFPERINALFSPYLEWQDVKGIIWRVISSPASEKNPVMVNLGTLAPSGTPWLSVPEAVFFPEIKRLSGGKVQVKIYAGGVMGEDTDILRKMDIGQLDACGCTSLGVWAASPDTSAMLIPGLFNNYEEIDYICEKFRKRLDETFEKRGYILAALIDTGFFYMFSKNKITGLADLRNQKTLMWFPAIETLLYKELGINATPVAVPEIVSALSTGMADTNLAPAAWMLGMQAYQYSNYYLTPPIFYSPGAVIVSTQFQKKIEKQLNISPVFSHNFKEIFVFELNSIEPEWRVQLRNYEKKCLEAFETKCGIKPMTFSPEDQATLKKAGKAVQEQLGGQDFSKDLMNDMLKALEEYRAAHQSK
jgi:TRAP-type C4-dicarboxylate transport system substrate-binding protein